MDFNSMKRKELQCLCKKNKIPANLSNLEMANKLTTLFKEMENPITRGLIRRQDENESEAECNVVLERKAKKVRFSPEHELIEFTRSREKKRRSKRTSVFVENTLRVQNVDQASLRKGNIDCSVRVTQSRGKNSVDGVRNVTKRGRKYVKSDSNIDSKAVNDVDNERVPEEVIDGPRRVTRSRGQKLMEGLVGEEKRGRNNLGNGEKKDKSGLVSAKDNGITVITRRSYRNRGVADEGKLARDSGVSGKNNGKGREQQVLESKRTSEENMIVAPQKKKDLHIEEPVKVVLRRSNRGNSVLPWHDELGNNELTVVKKDRCSLRISELQLGTIGGVSENDEKVTQSSGVSRRSRRATLSLKPVPTDEKVDTAENPDTAQQLREPCPKGNENPLGQEEMRRSERNVSKNISPEILDEPGEAVVRQQQNKGRKHKRCPVPEENVGKSDNDPRPLTQSLRGTCRNHKTSSESAIRKIDDQTEALCRSKDLNLWEDSSLKGLLTIGVSLFADAQLSVSGVSESSGNSALSSNTSAKNVNGNIRLTSSRKHHKKDQDTSTANGSEVKAVHDEELGTLDEDPTSRITNLPADCTDSENEISGSKTMVVDKVQILELDEQEIVEKNISKNDPNESAAQVFCRQETFNCVCIIKNQEQSDASNVSVETSSSSDNRALALAALEVTEVEADKKIQPSSAGADHGKIKSISVDENLEPFEPECINDMPFPTECHVDVHLEVTMDEGDKNTQRSSSVVDHGKIIYISVGENLELFEPECINELTLPTECHVDVLNQLEASDIADTTHKVGEAGAFEPCEGQINPTESMSTFKRKEPSSGKLRRGLDADHIAEGGRLFGHKIIHSELAEADEARYTKDLKSISNDDVEFGLSILFDGERSAKIIPQDREMCFDEYSIKDSSEQGILHDHLATVPTSMFVNSTESKLGRGLETDNVAEGDETYGHKGVYQELTETEAGGFLKDPKSASDEDRAYTVSTPFEGQRSDSIMPQDAGILSGACSIKDSGDLGMFCDTIAISPTSIHAKGSENKFSAYLADHHISEEGETYFSKDVHSESDETGSRYLRYHESTSDNDRELSMFNLLDDERNEWVTFQDVGIFSRKYSIKDSDEQGLFHDSQDIAPPTMYANCTENKFSPGCSSLLDINWPGPESVSKSQGSCATSFGTCPFSKTEAGVSNPIEEKETTISESKIPGDEMSMDETIRQHEISNQDHESSNIGICEPEQPKSPLAEHVATLNNSEVQGDWSGGSKTTVNAMSIVKYSIKGEIVSQGVDKAENQMQNPIATAAKSVSCEKEKENFTDAQTLEVAESMDETISKLGIESQSDWKLQDIEETSTLQDIEETGDLSQNLITHEALSSIDEDLTDVEFNQSWQEIDLNNLLETIVDIVTPIGVNQTSSHATEIENLTVSMNKCIASSGCGSLTEKDIEMEEERGREDEETTNKNLVLPIAYKEESDIGSKVGREEHRLQSPFATPIEIVAPSQVEETSYEKNSEKAPLSIVECVGGTKEEVVNQTKSNEKVEDAENELENTLSIENLLLPNGAVISNEERNKVDGVELPNIYSSTVLSEGTFDGNEVQWIENADNCMEESNSRAEENDEENIFSVGLSFFGEEAIDNDSKSTEKNIIIPSISQENLYEVEGCCNMFLDCNLSGNLSYRNRVYVESEGKFRQCSGSACSETEDDLQKANVPEDSHCFTDYHKENSFLRESSSDPYGEPLNPEVANVGIFNGEKNMVIHKDTPPSILSRASHEDDEVTERKNAELTRDEDEVYGANTWDDADDNLRSCNEFLGEQHINSEMTVLESYFDGYTPCQEAKVLSSNDELQSTCREMAMLPQSGDNIIPAAEYGSTICGNASDVLCILAKHPFIGDAERGDAEKSEPETTNFGLERDQEKDGGEVEDNSTAEIVLPQMIISELHLEEKVGDFTNNILTVTDTPVVECSAVNSKDGRSSVSKRCSTAKKNARTILIHGTPKKLLRTANMKENAPKTKRSQIGNFTTMRPPKRRALQDVQWKY